jgi:Protein of unknown function (DUF4197)
MRRILFTVLTASILSACSHAQLQLDQLWKKASKPTTAAVLSDDRITAGLKEALTISTRSAVASSGQPDGFLKNAAIKIVIPPKLHSFDKGMRMIGKGAEMDELEIGMNRAAEEAAPEAKKIFLDALSRMTFDDARRILSEGDTAATEYFKQQTSVELAAAFQPIVHSKLETVGVVKQYDQLMRNPLASSLLGRNSFDLDDYVVSKSLDGLFYMLAEEERKIRKDPAEQTTALLRDVFGRKLQSAR